MAGVRGARPDARRGIQNPDPGKGTSPVYLFYGEEGYLVEDAAKKLVDALVPSEQREFGLEILSGTAVTIAEISGALATLPLFSGNRLVWLRGCGVFRSTGRADAVREKLPRAGERTVALITEESIDRRFALYADIGKRGIAKEFKRLSETKDGDLRYIYDLVSRRLQTDGVTISRDTLFYLVQLVGTELRPLLGEIEKLALSVGPGCAIDRSVVDRLVSPSREAEAYQLPDAVTAGDLRRALGCLRRLLAQRIEPLVVMESLTRRMRFLLQAKELLEKGIIRPGSSYPAFTQALSKLPQSLREAFPDKRRRKRYSILAQHPYVVYQICKGARRLSPEKLRKNLDRVVTADTELKGGRRSKSEALEDLVVSLCAR
ncbi:MAG: DNA polymerase III subunit delta [bacterium]